MSKLNFQYQIHTNQKIGHYLFESTHWPERNHLSCDILIVGGGIAGLSAAAQLADQNILLCELNEHVGGTASCWHTHGEPFATGAHYELPYPHYFGKAVPDFFKSLDLVEYDDEDKTWYFKDERYYIDEDATEQCFVNHTYQDDIFPASKAKRYFERLMHEYEGGMVMPTTMTPQKLHYLNGITFLDYLKNAKVNDKLISGINYKMRDDYGANADQVSALAGIHYYSCRNQDYLDSIFSPPEGNAYFSHKIANRIPSNSIKTQHLVKHIEKNTHGYTACVLDLRTQTKLEIHCKSVIYAGLKPALQKIYPVAYPLFEKNEYSAWMAIQFKLKASFHAQAFWQNEILLDEFKTPFLGFVDSAAQDQQKNSQRVLTAYFCFKPEERQKLMDIEQHVERYLQDATDLMSLYFNQELHSQIDEAHVFLHGHAMPIPAPGYLLNNRNKSLIAEQGFFFAGVDNGRLPLLFEAVDSGLEAAELAAAFLG